MDVLKYTIYCAAYRSIRKSTRILAETKRVLFRGLSAIPEEQNAPGGAKAERAGSALAGEVGLRPLDNAPWLKRNFHLQNVGFSIHKPPRVRLSIGPTSRGGDVRQGQAFSRLLALIIYRVKKILLLIPVALFEGAAPALRRIV